MSEELGKIEPVVYGVAEDFLLRIAAEDEKDTADKAAAKAAAETPANEDEPNKSA
ncbi:MULTISPECIES: hypothetical protein [Streptomyces]|uniref:hypothetical protein n=1 Tax=Streptomyces TaxID=1883 RepID=UPI000FBEDE13|nr:MULTISPECIES: hypothetical protein [unclassified Streptomyces]RPK81418.1 hypothetical protein EES45_10845 [Streptomyces sp. ADI97-07]WSK20585.1 hypothetical protein OG730_15190 [Streptomyces sp. NBC_01298]WSK21238.1 hypothetical protein OG730_18890 [Streptomyces sp. NBC_01298]